MDVDTIRVMYGYDRWVNQRLWAVVVGLPTERTREPLGSSFGSVHGTLAHILGSQIHWLNRWRCLPPTRQMGGEDFDCLETIRARWQEHWRELDALRI